MFTNLEPLSIVSMVTQFFFYFEHHSAGVDAAGTTQAAFTAEHAFAHLLIGFAVFAAADERVHLPEVEWGEVACRTGCRAASASDAASQVGHIGKYLLRDEKVVAVEVHSPRL